jgi:c-di-AMP phosphodiesterase-like protein
VLINIEDLDEIDEFMIDGAGSDNEEKDDSKKLLCNYDSDWSEIEDLMEDLSDDDSDEIEEFLKAMLNNYGTLGLVFYKRFSNSKLVQDLQKEVINSLFKFAVLVKKVLI